MKLKRLLSVLLVAALLLTSIGCVEKDSSGNPIAAPGSQAQLEATEQDRFDAYLLGLFQEEAGRSLFDSRFLMRHPENFGITDIPLVVGSIDFEELDNAEQEWQKRYDALMAFDSEKLTAEQQLTYELIRQDLELLETVQGLGYYQEYNSPLLGIQSQLPALLGEFKLYTVQDAYDYITMLESVPLYFGDLLKFQQRKSEKGLFMSDAQVDETLNSCQSFLADEAKNPLITGFKGRISGLPGITTQDIAKLEELNRKAVLEKMLPAYEDFMAGLKKLKGTGKNENGLCGLPEGKRYYEYLVQRSTGSDRTMKQLIKMIDNELTSCFSKAQQTMNEDSEVLERWDTTKIDITDPMDILEVLRKRSEKDFPPLRELNYQVKYVDPAMEEYTSPAYFIIPQVDNNEESTIYMNGKYKDDINYLFTTMGHEGYPGHMYQINYFQELNPHPIRSLLGPGGYSEGWATYVEQLSYEMMELHDPALTTIMQCDNMLNLMLSCRIDIGVNYEGWDLQQTVDYLQGYGLDDEEMADSIRSAVIENPGNYLQYGVGVVEFQKLRRYAEMELDEDFSAMEFHKALLDIGPAPFSMVRTAVEQYISKTEAASESSGAAPASQPQQAA